MSDFTAAVDQVADCECGGALYVDDVREQRVGALAIVRCTRCARREGRLASFGLGAQRPAIRGGAIVIETHGRLRDAARRAA